MKSAPRLAEERSPYRTRSQRKRFDICRFVVLDGNDRSYDSSTMLLPTCIPWFGTQSHRDPRAGELPPATRRTQQSSRPLLCNTLPAKCEGARQLSILESLYELEDGNLVRIETWSSSMKSRPKIALPREVRGGVEARELRQRKPVSRVFRVRECQQSREKLP